MDSWALLKEFGWHFDFAGCMKVREEEIDVVLSETLVFQSKL